MFKCYDEEQVYAHKKHCIHTVVTCC